MLATKEMPLNFDSPEHKQKYFVHHAEYFTVTVRVSRTPVTSAYDTLLEARAAAKTLANDLKRPTMIYAIIGSSAEWVENIYPRWE